jgi:hypothetical protein
LNDLIEYGVVLEIRLSGEAIESLDVLSILRGSLNGKVVADIFNLDWNKRVAYMRWR